MYTWKLDRMLMLMMCSTDHNIQRGIDADYTDITHIFDLANPAGAEFMPIVDMWYDFSEHLKEEDIPSPLELINERDQIIR